MNNADANDALYARLLLLRFADEARTCLRDGVMETPAGRELLEEFARGMLDVAAHLEKYGMQGATQVEVEAAHG